MSIPVQVLNYADFTGGLNMRADAFQLAPNESPDLLNVDIDPRGGFRLRKAVGIFSEDAADADNDFDSIGAFETPSIHQVIAVKNKEVFYSDEGADFADTTIALTVDTPTRMVSYKDMLYIQNGTDAPSTWDGTADGTLTQSYNEDLTAPAGGNMPIAKLIAVFQNHVFVANTYEGSASFGSRVRFSHPNFPEDYRSTDYFDVDTGGDGDEIVALVPDGDRLLIFKQHSTHALFGYDADSFQLQAVTHSLGTISQESVAATEVGIYFFSWPKGVFKISGTKVEDVFDRLYPTIQDGSIDPTHQDLISLGYGNRRLWVSLPLDSNTVNTCFVLDPTLGKEGSWVKYDTRVGPFLEWKPTGLATKFLGCGIGTTYIQELDVDETFDVYALDTGDPVPSHINSYFETPWVYQKQPAIKKRWKRPLIVARADATATIPITVYKDFDKTNAIRNYSIAVTGPVSGSLWGTFVWGTDPWTATPAPKNELVKGSSMGPAKAVKLRFQGPSDNVGFGIDAISFKYQMLPVH